MSSQRRAPSRRRRNYLEIFIAVKPESFLADKPVRLELARAIFHRRCQYLAVRPAGRVLSMTVERLLGLRVDQLDRQRRRPRAARSEKKRRPRKHAQKRSRPSKKIFHRDLTRRRG